jgi:hypothetical protein
MIRPNVQEAGWAQDQYGRCGTFHSTSGFEPRTVQPVASRYTDWTIPAHKHILYKILTSNQIIHSLRAILFTPCLYKVINKSLRDGRTLR